MAPGLSLAGVRLVIADLAVRLPVLRTLSLCTCCRHYPGAAAGRNLRSCTQPYQPSPISLSGRPARSDHAAWDRARRPKLCKLACRPFLSRTVSIKLRRQWSPEQIAGWLKRAYPGELQNQVSHETIYRSLFIQARGVLKKELLEHLRAKRTIRRSKPD